MKDSSVRKSSGREAFSASLTGCYPPPILRQRVARNIFIIIDLTLHFWYEFAKDEWLKRLLLIVYRIRQCFAPACRDTEPQRRPALKGSLAG